MMTVLSDAREGKIAEVVIRAAEAEGADAAKVCASIAASLLYVGG